MRLGSCLFTHRFHATSIHTAYPWVSRETDCRFCQISKSPMTYKKVRIPALGEVGIYIPSEQAASAKVSLIRILRLNIHVFTHSLKHFLGTRHSARLCHTETRATACASCVPSAGLALGCWGRPRAGVYAGVHGATDVDALQLFSPSFSKAMCEIAEALNGLLLTGKEDGEGRQARPSLGGHADQEGRRTHSR